MTRALVDSNIIVYSLTSDDERKKTDSLNLLLELARNHELVFSSQNIAETARVLLEKTSECISPEDMLCELRDHCKKADVVSYSNKTVFEAILISSKYKLHFFDALLAATMKENSIKVIYTENVRDFKNLPFIKAINPFN